MMASGAAIAQSSAPAADLSGLWKAKKWFGPDVRGELIVERRADGLHAGIAGRSARVTRHAQDVAFELPGNEGAFAGRFEGPGIIRGHWIRSPSAVSY